MPNRRPDHHRSAVIVCIKQRRGAIPTWILAMASLLACREPSGASEPKRPDCGRSPAILEDTAAPIRPAGSGRLERDKLLVFRDAQGRVGKVQSLADWQLRRAEILDGMQQIMGALPGPSRRCPLELLVEEEVDRGGWLQRKVTYAAEPRARVPAYLLVPKPALEGQPRAAGVLCLHPTNLVLGPQVVAGLGGRAAMHYGKELVERGFVVLAPCYPRMAGYEPDLESLGYASTTMKAIWDNIRGVDLLLSLPYVRGPKVAVIGHSLGGHNAVYTAVFDERILAVASSCGLDSFLDYKSGDIRGWASRWYMPRLLDYKDRLAEIPFDFHEVVGALAPRWCYLNAPRRDDNFKWQSVERVAAAARQVYTLHGQPERLKVEHPDCGHDFPEQAREEVYRLFERVLGEL